MIHQIQHRLVGLLGLCSLATAAAATLSPDVAPLEYYENDEVVASNATFFNSASQPGADTYAIFDSSSGQYYAYSTEGADDGWHFAIYRSPDLATWEQVPGGALRQCNNNSQPPSGQICWARDWIWAPEVYHNEKTGVWFIFFAGRLRQDLTAEWFRYSAFEEPSKIGVAVSKSPEGPFQEIEPHPIEYYPFDPDYHDVNLIMDASQTKPPPTRQEGRTAPQGIFIPTIDPNVYFDLDERVYLYYSRNAYRNWVWDTHGLGKYIEESNILAVELNRDWWDDPEGRTMPTIVDAQVDANKEKAVPLPSNITSYNATGEVKEPKRKDGWRTLISYNADPQEWENYHVDDYAKFNGTRKDRRWSEGSTLLRRNGADGKPLYFMTYSCNNFEASRYGVGYATSPSPLGPFTKAGENPVLSQKADTVPPVYSVGHGSVVATYAVPPANVMTKPLGVQDVTHYTPPYGSELFYVHHGRNSTEAARTIYTTRMSVAEAEGKIKMELTTADQPVANGVAPYRIEIGREGGMNGSPPAQVFSAAGARFDLNQPTNRIAYVDDGDGAKRARYERLKVDGSWAPVFQNGQPLTVHD